MRVRCRCEQVTVVRRQVCGCTLYEQDANISFNEAKAINYKRLVEVVMWFELKC